MKGIVFNIQRYAVHDGPGIRTTVFLKGCPLSCPWCHNPEGVSPEAELVVVRDRCCRCGACVAVCPNPPASAEDGAPITDRARCLACGRCVEACVRDARSIAGRYVTVRELADEVEHDRVFYEESEGGVTLSGGEPFAQPDFLMACLAELRARGIHTAVDTSGCADRDLVLRAAESTDLFLFDLKLMDPEKHQRLTGTALDPIVENLRALDGAGAEVWVRFPLIPGITDSMENVAALGRTVLPLRTRRVHVLPFHRTAADKYARIGKSWEHKATTPPTDDAVDRVVDALKAMGLDAVRGG